MERQRVIVTASERERGTKRDFVSERITYIPVMACDSHIHTQGHRKCVREMMRSSSTNKRHSREEKESRTSIDDLVLNRFVVVVMLVLLVLLLLMPLCELQL